MRSSALALGGSFSVDTLTRVDANGFTLAEAAELRRRIADVEKGKITARGIIET